MSISLELTIFSKLFAAVAEEMGIVLRKARFPPTSRSAGIIPAPCAPRGGTPGPGRAYPVHLGALPRTLARVLPEFPLGPGDVLLLNDPYWGGTHLPDLTVMAPVYAGERLAFYLVNRAHHADVGGTTPGSMPLARSLEEEGVVIPPSYLFKAGSVPGRFLSSLVSRMRVPGGTPGRSPGPGGRAAPGAGTPPALDGALRPGQTAGYEPGLAGLLGAGHGGAHFLHPRRLLCLYGLPG